MNHQNKIITLFFVTFITSTVNMAEEWKNPDAPSENSTTLKEKPPMTKENNMGTAETTTLSGTHGLSVSRICSYQRTYRDKGSGGKIDGSFYIPVLPQGFMMIGGYAQGNYHKPAECVLAVQSNGPSAGALLRKPNEWLRLWTDKGSGAKKDGSVWHPTVSDNNYTCIGSVAIEGYSKPNLDNYTCLHRCLVEQTPVAAPVWSTAGTGAKKKVYIYSLNNSNGFYASTEKIEASEIYDVKSNLQCEF